MVATTLAALLFESDIPLDRPLVRTADTSHTRAEIEAKANELATRLRQHGVEPGMPVAVMLPNNADLVAALFGVWRAGAVYVPLNPRLAEREVANTLELVRPAAVVTTSGVDDHTRAAQHDLGVALIQFTSGTTGRPKPVLLRHGDVLTLLDGVIRKLRQRESKASDTDREPMPNLIPVSLSLWAGIYQVLFALRVGAGVILMEQFNTGVFAELVRRFQIRSTVLPPAAMTMLSDDSSIDTLAPLAYVRSITAPLSPLQARRFRDRFGISVLNGYGQTEIGGEIVGWSGRDAKTYGDTKLGSVGRPHEGVSVRVIDAHGNEVGADEPGQLVVRTPALASVYADGNDLSDRLTPDGWFRTGDVGRVDADGFVWIEGRVSDMINRGGLKVFPEEVAEVLRLSSAVIDAAVVGVPDERLGEVPWAFVVTDDAPVDAVELEAFARQHLAPYKVPVRFCAIDELPRNEIGKVLATELVRRAEHTRSEEAP